jgi:hypothetical protein
MQVENQERPSLITSIALSLCNQWTVVLPTFHFLISGMDSRKYVLDRTVQRTPRQAREGEEGFATFRIIKSDCCSSQTHRAGVQQAKVLIHNGGGIRPLLVPPAQQKSAIIVHVALVT